MDAHVTGTTTIGMESERTRSSRRSSVGYEANSVEPRVTGSGLDNGIHDGLLDGGRMVNEVRAPIETFDVEVSDPANKIPKTPDVNVYQQKKTLAQGMMDLALLSANANQLRYVLESGSKHPYYIANLTLISISLILQIAVGVGLILNSRYNVKRHEDMCKANSFNNFTVVGVFVVTIVNVFISAFGIGTEVEPGSEEKNGSSRSWRVWYNTPDRLPIV